MFQSYFKSIDEWSLGILGGKYTFDERHYLYSRIQEARAKMCDAFALVSIGFDTLMFVCRNVFPQDTALSFACRHAYLLAVVWLMQRFFAKTSSSKQLWQTIGSSLTSVICAWIIFDLVSHKDAGYKIDSGFLLSYVIVVGAFVILMAWVSRPALLIISLVSMAFSWKLPDLVEGAPNRYVACSFILILPILNHALHLRQLRTEAREMGVRLATMPRRIALSLVEQDQSPKERFCICLSSDWRGYQELVSGMSDERVVALLEDYYQRVQDLLSQELYEYDYYMDWIADELFAVIYSAETDRVNLLARQKMATRVVELSQQILDMKDVFAADHKLQLGVDIGLSSGQSLIGIIGPTNHRKATALGSNPGRARRLQGCGKLLRHEIHDEDRIIFGDEMLFVLQAPTEMSLEFGTFDTSSRRLRNLEDQNLYYVGNSADLALNASSEAS